MPTKKALVRRPSPRLAEGIVSFLPRRPVDVQLAGRQWEAYVAALSSAGWEVVEVVPAGDCPDSVFVEDTMVVFRDRAVMARSGARARRAEVDGAREAVEAVGYPTKSIEAPGTVDGGDVLKIGNTIYVGQSGRTNAAGFAQLCDLLEPAGARLVPVPVTKVLHLKSSLTALPDGTAIGLPSLVDDPDLFPRFRPVAEADGGPVVLLGGRKVLLAAGCPQTEAMLRELGYQPVVVDISEFLKVEGSVTCLSVRLRG